ncbi:hypothetical protein JI435_406440 [Parastagonospora nodorum SN15]|uniref:Uncharacterized protein n=1 Tax=Phaeosphaeria nodorum (strain SN15 / ATCC MYA-4574 / FGSC 10173) TaxID=321614 RepID=A0A7U2EY09_PHANO|nr:hypothetical protein JI435_406440 [Parastagonospora nodorum SN15]
MLGIQLMNAWSLVTRSLAAESLGGCEVAHAESLVSSPGLKKDGLR